MCDDTIACVYKGAEGRVGGLKINPIDEEVCGQFFDRNSNVGVQVKISEVKGLNKKAQRKLVEAVESLWASRKKLHKEKILS